MKVGKVGRYFVDLNEKLLMSADLDEVSHSLLPIIVMVSPKPSTALNGPEGCVVTKTGLCAVTVYCAGKSSLTVNSNTVNLLMLICVLM